MSCNRGYEPIDYELTFREKMIRKYIVKRARVQHFIVEIGLWRLCYCIKGFVLVCVMGIEWYEEYIERRRMANHRLLLKLDKQMDEECKEKRLKNMVNSKELRDFLNKGP